MAQYRCYIDKEASTFFDYKLVDKDTDKRIVLKLSTPGLKLNYWFFRLWHSSDKGIFDRDSDTDIVVTGTKLRETKSAIFVSIKKKDEGYKTIKNSSK